MQLTYLGHAVFLIETNGIKIIIDPYIDDNPLCPIKMPDLGADFVVITHAHWDHWGNTLDFVRAGAVLVAASEVTDYVGRLGMKNLFPMNVGGSANFPFGKLKFVPACHSSNFPDGTYGGPAMGVVLEIEGKKIYHAGDTALFLDMKLIGNLGLDLALLPIGDNYTMGPADALDSLELLKPKTVIPMHYDTFDVIRQDPEIFVTKAELLGTHGIVMKPGTSLEL